MACMVDHSTKVQCVDSRLTSTHDMEGPLQGPKGCTRMKLPIQNRLQTQTGTSRRPRLGTLSNDREQLHLHRDETQAIQWAEDLALLSHRRTQTPCQRTPCLCDKALCSSHRGNNHKQTSLRHLRMQGHRLSDNTTVSLDAPVLKANNLLHSATVEQARHLIR